MKTTKEVILSLIKDDLTNLTLIKGLNKLGLDADDYNLNLSDSIIVLINKNLTDIQNEVVHKYYCDMTNKIVEYELSNITIKMKAEEIYNETEARIKDLMLVNE